MNDAVWRAAQQYMARGWSVLPMKPKQKLTTLAKWAPFQSSPASLEQLREWFTGSRPARRLGLIMGQASGGLAIRDFDKLEAYECWVAQFPNLAAELPTVRTGRGCHVYFRTNESILKPFGTRKGAIEFADGELRAWSGCYTLAPPSRHESGIGYDWIIPLMPEELPLVDPVSAGMIGPDAVKNKTDKPKLPVQLIRANYWASKFPPVNDADWRLFVKLDIALQRGLVNEHAINDSFEAVKQCGAMNQFAYFTQAAKEHCERLGTPWKSIQAIHIPKCCASYEATTRHSRMIGKRSGDPMKIGDCLNKLISERGYGKPDSKSKAIGKCHTEDSLPEVSGIPAVSEDAEVPANAANPRERILQDVIKGRKSPLKFTSELSARVNDLVTQTLPRRTGERHKQMFELCRALQGIPELAEADGVQLEPVMREWYRRALPNMTTKSWDENWFDFLESWDKVEFPYGADRVDLAFERALNNPLPAESGQFEQQPIKLLLALCRELQIMRNGEPFFLSVRTAAKLLEVDPTSISRWLRGFTKIGLLYLVKAGTSASRQASEFFYLGELPAQQI